MRIAARFNNFLSQYAIRGSQYSLLLGSIISYLDTHYANLNTQILNNHHRVAVAVKAIFFFNSNFVSVHYVFISAESANHH